MLKIAQKNNPPLLPNKAALLDDKAGLLLTTDFFLTNTNLTNLTNRCALERFVRFDRFVFEIIIRLIC